MDFPNPNRNPYPNSNWQSNSEVCTVGIGRTCYCLNVCLWHRRLFLLPIGHPTHYEVGIFLSSMLWRLAICISRCWRMSSILSRIYTSLPSTRDSPRKTCTRFHHLFRKVHWVHDIYITRFEVTHGYCSCRWYFADALKDWIARTKAKPNRNKDENTFVERIARIVKKHEVKWRRIIGLARRRWHQRRLVRQQKHVNCTMRKKGQRIRSLGRSWERWLARQSVGSSYAGNML